jgi:hypothetical protein
MREHVLILARGIPRLFGRALFGGFVGGVVGLLVGAIVSAVVHLLGWGGGEGWTAFGLATISAAAFMVGGAYIGALHGCARALGMLIGQLDLVPKLWTLVKPHIARYAKAAQSGARHAEARAEALRGLQEDERDEGEAPEGIAERAERYLAGLLHGVLVGGLLRGLLGRNEASWDDVEGQGLGRATLVVGDLIARLFHGPALLAMLITVAVAVAPHAVFSLLAG